MSASRPKTLYIDYSRCIGCESCEAICKFMYGIPRIQMTRTDDGKMLPLYCRHCKIPLCAKGCPEGVVSKQESGVVLLDPDFGSYCNAEKSIRSCPYAAMFRAGGRVPITKCDLCAKRREDGLEPACALICPTEAIFYMETAKHVQLKTENANKAAKEVMRHIKQLRTSAD